MAKKTKKNKLTRTQKKIIAERLEEYRNKGFCPCQKLSKMSQYNCRKNYQCPQANEKSKPKDKM